MATGEALAARTTGGVAGLAARLWRWLRDDWRTGRATLWGAALALLTLLAVTLYYRATPAVIHDPDTSAYLRVAQTIAHEGTLVNPARLPGYPLFIDAVTLFAGPHALEALGPAQAALFVVAIVEVYVIGLLTLRRAWMAFIPAALVGINVYVISFVKPLLTEGLTLALVTTLALAVVWWVAAPSPRRLWLVALALAVTFMTRPEWVYLPIPLMAALALLAWRRGDARSTRATLTHGALAVVALYALVGVYILANGALNGYFGFSDIQAFNLLGKVTQYHLVGQAPARYAAVDQAMQGFLARGMSDPWLLARIYPPFRSDHFQLMSSYSTAMILTHPGAFIVGCWGTLIHSLTSTEPFHPLPASGGGALLALGTLARVTLQQMWLILLIAPAWWLLWALGRGDDDARRRAAQMSALALLVAYDLVMTTAGGYIYYARLHTPFAPLLMLVVVGSALLAAERGVRWLRGRVAQTQIAEAPHE